MLEHEGSIGVSILYVIYRQTVDISQIGLHIRSEFRLDKASCNTTDYLSDFQRA